MKQFYVVYDVNTGLQTSGCGLVDDSLPQDGSTAAEWILTRLAKNTDNRVAYFDAGVNWDCKTKKIENGAIVDRSVAEIDTEVDEIHAMIMLRKRYLELFQMILTIWQVGVDKGIWANTDLSEEVRSIAIEWKQYLQKIKGI